MQKQLSKKSHKATQSSIDDFMKNIRKYNLQSQRYISPKPLLYMYSNPSRHCTLQTLQKSRSKSKTLSNRQHSNLKKSSSKTIRQKVQKMLSLTKKQNIHKKSISSISNKNEKSIKNLNKSTAQIDFTKSKKKIKHKINEFKLKPMTSSCKKNKKSKSKLQEPYIKLIQTSPIRSGYHDGQESQFFQFSEIHNQNPAELIEMYSKKLFKVQLYLETNKNKLGSMLCRKFQQILNQIVESLVQNLKKSLNELQIDIEKRLTRQFQKEFDKSMMKKEEELRTIEKVCEKITKKYGQQLHKQHYTNTLIYNLRLGGIDIDNEFGKAVWGVQNLGGLGYGKTETLVQEQNLDGSSTHRRPVENMPASKQNQRHQQSSEEDFQFRQHPNAHRIKQKQPFQPRQAKHRGNDLTEIESQIVEVKNLRKEKKQQILTIREEQNMQFRLKTFASFGQGKKSL